jgi:Tol biopolymer transport system component
MYITRKIFQQIVCILVLGVSFWVFTIPRSAEAQSVKLVSMPEFGDVQNFKISPDNQYVVYLADQDEESVNELYSIPLRGGKPEKLNGPIVSEGRIHSYIISQDSKWVVYRADQDTEDVYEIYSVPIDGPYTASEKLNSQPPTGEVRTTEYLISHDSKYVLFVADQEIDGDSHLYRVPIDGPANEAVRLSSQPDVGAIDISSDGNMVVYKSKSREYQYELYSVPLGGVSSEAEKISHPLRITLFVCVPSGRETRDSVHSFSISSDGTRVVYKASYVLEDVPDDCFDDIYELYSVPIEGPQDQAIQIQEAIYPYYGYDVTEFAISGDSERVIYSTYQNPPRLDELHSIPILGPPGASIKLNKTLVFDGDVFDFTISPDGSRVVYVADQDTDMQFELYSVPAGGPADEGVKLNQPMDPGSEVDEWNFEVSPNNEKLVYVAGEAYVDWNVFSVPLTGPSSEVEQISGPMKTGGFVYSFITRFKISPDSQRVIYRADQDTFGVYELYIVSIDGPMGSSKKINGSMDPDGDIDMNPTYSFCPNSKCVVYIASQDTSGIMELYAYFESGAFTLKVYLPLVLR